MGSINGKINDKQTNEGLAGATITIKGSLNFATTNNEGDFLFKKINAGKVSLVISYVGYETIELTADVISGTQITVNAVLTLDTKGGNEIVVSASKRPEKITNAPASIQVIGIKDLDQFAGSNVGELISRIQGIEYTRNGVTDITFNARGFHSAFNNKVFQLVDGRNSMAALSGSLPVMNRGTIIKDDIERLEIVLGPQTALYGPNAHNAIFNTITKDPRRYQGTTVSVSAGSRYQFSGRIRHAAKINNKWAYKLTGEYATGKEFIFNDSVYAGNQSPTVQIGETPPPVSGPYGPAVAIPERNVDFDFRHMRGEAHLYYSINPKADVIISGGGSNNNWPQVTTGGRNQMIGVIYSFLQARFVQPRFFATIYNTWGSLGSSYLIGAYTRDYWNRTHSTLPYGDPSGRGYLPPEEAEKYALRYGNRFKERSQRLNAEAQYNYTFEKAGLFLVAGANYQKENPNGYGITLVDSFYKIRVAQFGAVLQLEKKLPWDIRLIGAMRWDNHSNFGNFFAPKFAVVKKISDGSFRITWGRAYAMPSILNQYAGINRSLFGNGEGITYEATPGDHTTTKTTEPLKPEEVATWEVGYKGTIAKKLFIDINYYNGSSKNFLSPARSVAGKAIAIGEVPVTPSNPNSFSTFFNYAAVKAYGLDAGLSYSFNKFINLALKYSWFDSDITSDDKKNDANNDGYVSLEETSLNAPNHRGLAALSFQNLCKQKLFINVATRFVQQYDFYSGSQIGTEAGKGKRGKVYGGKVPNGQPRYYLKNFDWGPLGGFATVDLSAGYKFTEMLQVNVGITNVFDTEQIEFVGSPSIGRLIMFELKVHVPNKKE
jgi:iron complex outermembrane receptor protein